MLRLESEFGVFCEVNISARLKESLNEEVRYGVFYVLRGSSLFAEFVILSPVLCDYRLADEFKLVSILSVSHKRLLLPVAQNVVRL